MTLKPDDVVVVQHAVSHLFGGCRAGARGDMIKVRSAHPARTEMCGTTTPEEELLAQSAYFIDGEHINGRRISGWFVVEVFNQKP